MSVPEIRPPSYSSLLNTLMCSSRLNIWTVFMEYTKYRICQFTQQKAWEISEMAALKVMPLLYYVGPWCQRWMLQVRPQRSHLPSYIPLQRERESQKHLYCDTRGNKHAEQPQKSWRVLRHPDNSISRSPLLMSQSLLTTSDLASSKYFRQMTRVSTTSEITRWMVGLDDLPTLVILWLQNLLRVAHRVQVEQMPLSASTLHLWSISNLYALYCTDMKIYKSIVLPCA